MRRRLLPLLLGLATACPDVVDDTPQPGQARVPAPPTTPPSATPTTTTTELPRFDLGQLKSDPELARRNQAGAADAAVLDDPRALEKLFEKPCGDPAEVKCKR